MKWNRILSIAQWVLIVCTLALIAHNEWDCYQGGGCFRMTNAQIVKTVRSSVEAGWDACQQEKAKL